MEADMIRTGRFTRDERIKRSCDIRNLFKNGRKAVISGAKLFYMPNGRSIKRIAFVLPRHYGTAVERNYSKRLSRESYRYFRNHIRAGYDMLLLVYPGNDSFSVRNSQLLQLIRKAGLFVT